MSNYGFNRCEIRIDGGDALAADDAGVFAVRRSDPERVLFVHAAGDTRSAVYFGAALRAAAKASFVLQSVAQEQTTDFDPSRFAFVVLSDSVALPAIFEHTLSAVCRQRRQRLRCAWNQCGAACADSAVWETECERKLMTMPGHRARRA